MVNHHRGHRAVLAMYRRGIDQQRHAPPVGRREHDLLGAHRPGPLQLAGQREGVKGDLAPVAEPAGQDLHERLRGAVRRAQRFDDPVGFPVGRHRLPGAGVDDQDAHGRGLDQGLEVGPRALAPAGGPAR